MKEPNGVPRHISFTPNGNRRHARLESIPLRESYMRGALRALNVAMWAHEIGAQHVTLFGLSCENMHRRSDDELDALQDGACEFFDLAESGGLKIHPFGKIDEFAHKPKYRRLYERLERLSNQRIGADDFVVHVAANYSGNPQHELGHFMQQLRKHGFEAVHENPMRHILSAGVPPVDLAIRTGGEHRISGLLPFQMAYAELYFTPVLWADFDRAHFNTAVAWYQEQPRNFGK